MSESSESFHLRATNAADAVALLEAANARGFVFPAASGWVSFVAGGVAGDSPARPMAAPPEIAAWAAEQDAIAAASANVCAHNRGLLIHYKFSADFGLRVGLFGGPEEVGVLGATFSDDGEPRDDTAVFVARGVFPPSAAEAVTRWLAAAANFHERQTRALEIAMACESDAERAAAMERYQADRYFVARALGLPVYAWLSFESERDHGQDSRIVVRMPAT